MASRSVSAENFRQRLADYVDLLREARETAFALGSGRGWAPEPGSAAHDAFGETGRFTGEYHVAFGLIWPIFEEMEVLEHLLTSERIFAWSALPVARAHIETSARVWWLLDPTVDGRTRRGRAYAIEAVAVRESERIEAFTGADVEAATEDLTRRATRDGFNVRRRRNLITKIGDIEWNGSQVVAGILGDHGKLAYAWFSGVIHGDPRRIGGTLVGQEAADGSRQLVVRVDASVPSNAVIACTNAFVSMFDRWSELYGWREWQQPSRALHERSERLYLRIYDSTATETDDIV